MSIPWDYYIKRRGINIVNFLKSRNCKTYEGLCDVLLKEGVEPPTRKEMEVHFPKVKTRKKPAPKKQTLGTKSSVQSQPKPMSRHEKLRQAKAKAATTEKDNAAEEQSGQS